MFKKITHIAKSGKYFKIYIWQSSALSKAPQNSRF